MTEWNEYFREFPPTKWAVIICFAVIGAIIPRDIGFAWRVITFLVGMVVAVVFSEPVRFIFDVHPVLSDAVAGLLALTGYNVASLIIWASKNPFDAIEIITRIWRGKRP